MANGLVGSGRVFAAPYAAATPFNHRDFRFLGNVSAMKYTYSEKSTEIPDMTSEAGGTADSYSRIDKVTIEMDLREFTPQNIAMALFGEATAQTASAITEEAGKVRAGNFTPTARIIDTTESVTIKKGATTLNTADYVIRRGGIEWASTFATSGLVDGDSVTIDYTPVASHDVETLVNTSPEVSIFFDGYNRNTGKPRTARLYRVKLTVAKELANIGEDLGTLQITGAVLSDDTITGVGLSRWMALEEA